MSRLIEFEKLHNVRDMGGAATKDGRLVAEGRLIRCGHLNGLSANDAGRLCGLADTIIDFRTYKECERQPDDKIPGTAYFHFPIMESMTAGITREKESDEALFAVCLRDPVRAKEYMRHTYRNFAEGDFAVSQYALFFEKLLEEHPKAVLWHCTAGKDRTGIAAAMVGELLGVEREDIVSDYLDTNKYIKEDYHFVCKMVKKDFGAEGPEVDEALEYLFLAQKEYIEIWYAAIEEKYGGFEAFARDGLKLTREGREKLKDLYLEKEQGE